MGVLAPFQIKMENNAEYKNASCKKIHSMITVYVKHLNCYIVYRYIL